MTTELVPLGPGHAMASATDIRPRSAMRHLTYVLFKWRRLILGLGVAFAVAAAIALLLRPPTYTASAKILVKGDRTPLNISGLTSPSGKIAYSSQVLQSEVQLFRSRDVVLPAARALANERGAGDADVEGIAGELANRIQPVALPDTNVIQVRYAAPTPTEAARVLRLVVDEYLNQHAFASTGSTRLLAFYERERDRIAGGLKGAEDALRQYQEENRIVAVDGQIKARIDVLGELERALGQAEAEHEATRARTDVLRRQVAGLPDRMITSQEHVSNPMIPKLKGDLATAEAALKDFERSPLVGKLRTDLAAAELALHELLQRYTEQDRRVEEKRAHIAAIKRELESATRDAEATARQRVDLLKRELAAAEAQGEILGRRTEAMNPVRDELERQRAGAESRLTALGFQIASLRRQTAAATAELASLRDKKTTVTRLVRDVDIHHEAFLVYGKRLEEARIAAGLDREQLASIALIEQPYVAPSDPPLAVRLAMVPLAGLLGLVVGLALAFGVEFFNHALRTREDVEHYLGLPVVAAIPLMEPKRIALRSV